MTTKRVMATFRPQQMGGFKGKDILYLPASAEFQFDVTEQIVAMGRAEALAIEDHTEAADMLWHNHPASSEPGAHDGPFEIEVQGSISDFYSEEAT